MAQEFLTTFGDELSAVTLKPGENGGVYRILVNDQILFDRKEFGGFADITLLKQMIRDIVNPEKSLGHSDKK